MIEASFATQYPQKDLYDDSMDWVEFTTLLNGITADTPLGKIIQIRAEDDREIINNFSKHEREIHDDWSRKQFEKKYKNKDKNEAMNEIKQMFKGLFG